jgi:four helix bundle protein
MNKEQSTGIKLQNTNNKTEKMSNACRFDLEERTLRFAKDCMELCKALDKNRINTPLIDQLIRSSTSVGANYREANQSLTKKDFYYRLNVCRKEAKESGYWLELLAHVDQNNTVSVHSLIRESLELVRIFSSIVLRNRF